MSDDLVKRLRNRAESWLEYECEDDAKIDTEAADHIEHLERELKEERHSREVAAAKAWEFSERIKELENKDD
jgi:hypothetical protein